MPDTVTVTDEQGRKATITYDGSPPTDKEIGDAFSAKYGPAQAKASKPAQGKPTNPFATAGVPPYVPGRGPLRAPPARPGRLATNAAFSLADAIAPYQPPTPEELAARPGDGYDDNADYRIAADANSTTGIAPRIQVTGDPNGNPFSGLFGNARTIGATAPLSPTMPTYADAKAGLGTALLGFPALAAGAAVPALFPALGPLAATLTGVGAMFGTQIGQDAALKAADHGNTGPGSYAALEQDEAAFRARNPAAAGLVANAPMAVMGNPFSSSITARLAGAGIGAGFSGVAGGINRAASGQNPFDLNAIGNDALGGAAVGFAFPGDHGEEETRIKSPDPEMQAAMKGRAGGTSPLVEMSEAGELTRRPGALELPDETPAVIARPEIPGFAASRRPPGKEPDAPAPAETATAPTLDYYKRPENAGITPPEGGQPVKLATGGWLVGTDEKGVVVTTPQDPFAPRRDLPEQTKAAAPSPQTALTLDGEQTVPDTLRTAAVPDDQKQNPSAIPTDALVTRTGIRDFASLKAAVKDAFPNLTPDQAHQSAVIGESLARGSAAAKGQTTAQWYKENLAGLSRGGEDAAQRFADIVNDHMTAEETERDGAAKPGEFYGAAEYVRKLAPMNADDARQVISSTLTHDGSTFPHEFAHVFQRQLGGADGQLLGDWAGAKNGRWDAEAQEKFATAYEKYLQDGEAPNPSLRTTFGRFKVWLTDIYNALRNHVPAESFTPEVKEMLARYHGDVSDITGEGVDNSNGGQGTGGTGRDRLGGIVQETPGVHDGGGRSVLQATGGRTVVSQPAAGATEATPGDGGSGGRGIAAAAGGGRPAEVKFSDPVSPGAKRVALVVDDRPRYADLPPDKAAEWDAELARYKAEQKSIKSGFASGGDRAFQASLERASARQHAATKREITGLLTEREQRAADKTAQGQGRQPGASPLGNVLPEQTGDGRGVALARSIPPSPGGNRVRLAPMEHTPGDAATVYTPANRPVQTRYAAVNADSLVPSQTDMLAPHPKYDQTLQPRDRSRIASLAQIDGIARKLNADRLGASSSTAEGSPIVGADGQVESGNGRALAIRRAYNQYPESAAAYKQSLIDGAAKYGLKPEDIAKHDRPVLVRVREGELAPEGRAALASEMGASPVAARSETEVAAEDGKRLRDTGLISRVAAGANGDLNVRENRDFVRQFMASVPEGERAALVQGDGSLSAQGLRRVRNAVLSSAYDDHAAVTRIAESTDDNVTGVGRAMTATAPEMARLKQTIASGDAHPLDITGDIAAAANKLSDLRARGQGVPEYLAQEQMFGPDLSSVGEKLLKDFDAFRRSPARIADLLRSYAQAAQDAGSPKQSGLFGDEPAPTPAQVLAQAENNLDSRIFAAKNDRARESRETGALFQSGRRQTGTRSDWNSPKTPETERNGVLSRGPVKLDSAYELLYAKMLDADPNVSNWVRLGRDLAIPYKDPARDNADRHYWPDFLVTNQDGTRHVVEVKPDAFIGTPNVAAKADAARAYLAGDAPTTARGQELANTGYKFVSEQNLDMAKIRAARAAARAGRVQDEGGAALFQRKKQAAPTKENTWVDDLMTLYKAGLVSSPRTVLKIALANGSMAVGETVSSHVAAVADMARVATAGALGGDKTDIGRIIGTGRAAVGVDLPTLARASLTAATQGVKGAGQILRTGKPDAANDPLGLQSGPGAFGHTSTGPVFKTGNKAFNAVADAVFNGTVNAVFNSHSAATYPAKVYAANASIAAQARLIAMAEAKAANTKIDPVRIKDLTTTPTPAMAIQALADAAVATFQNPNRLAKGVSNTKDAQRGNPFAVAAIDYALPIVKIPSNAAARGLEYAGGGLLSGPVGAGRAILSDVAASKADAEARQRFALSPTAENAQDMADAAKALLTPAFNDAERANFAKSIGRGATGAVLMAIGYQLASKGMLTGAAMGAGDYQKREKSGIPANSIHIGGTWHEIDALSPVGQMLALGATMNEHGRKYGSDAAGYAAGLAHTAGDLPLMEEGPLKNMTEKNPAQFAADAAQGAVPFGAAMATAAQAIDGGRERDTKQPKEATGINFNHVLARIPFLRSRLPEKQTEGKPVGGPLSALNPFKSRTGPGTANPDIYKPGAKGGNGNPLISPRNNPFAMPAMPTMPAMPAMPKVPGGK